jgi:salicylate hydroxylase
MWEHKSTPTYANARVCIIGDAAHTASPWQGAGAGLVVEDALILGSLLRNISSVEEINAAFISFDAVRRPRCQAVVDSSREAGRVFCGQNPDVGTSAERMGNSLGPLFAHIEELSLETHKQAAHDEFQKLIVN